MKTLRKSLLTLLLLGSMGVLEASKKDDLIQAINSAISLTNDLVPNLAYTGLAFAAGTAGICTSYNGFKRLSQEPKEESRKRPLTGVTEMSVGLGVTTLSVIVIHRLWK